MYMMQVIGLLQKFTNEEDVKLQRQAAGDELSSPSFPFSSFASYDKHRIKTTHRDLRP